MRFLASALAAFCVSAAAKLAAEVCRCRLQQPPNICFGHSQRYLHDASGYLAFRQLNDQVTLLNTAGARFYLHVGHKQY